MTNKSPRPVFAISARQRRWHGRNATKACSHLPSHGVAPGAIWTPLQVRDGDSAKKLHHFSGAASLGRPSQPAERSSINVQLGAEDASFATGHVYGSAGGAGQF